MRLNMHLEDHPNSFPLAVRTSHRYVGSCRGLDNWDNIGLGLISSTRGCLRTEEAENDPCDPRTVLHIVKVQVSAFTPLDTIKQALRDYFQQVGCHHEYDCCGCWSHRVRGVRRLGNDRRWAVMVSSSRNY